MPIVIGEKLGFALKSGGLIAGMFLADKWWTGNEGLRSRLAYQPKSGIQKEVTIAGAVRHPGIYLMGEDDEVSDLLRRAGGPTSPHRLCETAWTTPAADAVAGGVLDADPWVMDTRWQDGRQKPRHSFRSPRYQLGR